MTPPQFLSFLVVAFIVFVGLLIGVRAVFGRSQAPNRRIDQALGWLLTASLGVLFWVFYQDDAMVSDRGRQIMRNHFAIPADVTIDHVYTDKWPVCHRLPITYSVHLPLTEDQFERLSQSLPVDAPMAPPPLVHFETDAIDFAPEALTWRALEPPEDDRLTWQIAHSDIRRGQMLCYRLTQTDGQRYRAEPCDAREADSGEDALGHVEAALDSQQREFHAAMRFADQPVYCDNRVRRWVNRQLGLVEQR